MMEQNHNGSKQAKVSQVHYEADDISTYKRNSLLSQLLLLGATFSGCHFILDVFRESYWSSLLDFIIGAALLLFYFINKSGRHLLARSLTFTFLNIAIFVYANVVPREIGVYLLFIVLVGGSFVIFDYKQHAERALLSLFTIFLFLLCEYFDYQIFGSNAIIDKPDQFSFIINFLTTALVLYFSLNFIVRANYQAELDLKENAKELKELTTEIKQQNTHLEKTNSELDRFVYSTSHDLKAPLLSIKGLINIAKKEDPKNSLQVYFKMIEDRVGHLEKFIHDISQYSQNSRQEIQLTSVYIKDLVKQSIENLRFLDESNTIKFDIKDETKGPLIVDTYRISVLLNNLLSNAIKYHNFTQPEPLIKISIKEFGHDLTIMVSDNGSGIAPEQINRIFDMFYRGTERSNGAGLGLYITKEVVEKLQGEIKVRSAVGKGTLFKVTIPFVYRDEEIVPRESLT